MKPSFRFVLSCIAAISFTLVSLGDDSAPPPSDPLVAVPRARDFSWMSKAEWEPLHAENVTVAGKGDAKLVFQGDSIVASARRSEAWKKSI